MIPRRPTSRVRPAVATVAVLTGCLLILARLTGTDPMAARLADLRARGLPASAGEMERMVPAAPLASRTAVLGLVNPVLNIVTPRPHGLLRKADTLRFKAEAARTALAVAQWRSRHGRWPESLGEVFPAAGGVRHPIDPRSRQPLRWEATDVGFRIVGTPDADPKPLDDEDDRSLAIPVPAPPRP